MRSFDVHDIRSGPDCELCYDGYEATHAVAGNDRCLMKLALQLQIAKIRWPYSLPKVIQLYVCQIYALVYSVMLIYSNTSVHCKMVRLV